MSQEVIAPAPEEAPQPDRNSTLRFLRELPVLIALALGIALLIKAFLVQAFFIPSASMEPTLQRGDRVLVNKLSYRFGEPQRGDVIVFRDPYPDPCEQGGVAAERADCDRSVMRRGLNWFAEAFGLPTGETHDFIKRIVGMPGETIAMRAGEIFVCDAPGCVPLGEDGQPQDGERVAIPTSASQGPQRDDYDLPAFTIPRDQYYVLGDNRANSSDSRTFRGISRSDVVGKAFVLVWPPGRFSGL